jgi:hypothetical protein
MANLSALPPFDVTEKYVCIGAGSALESKHALLKAL